MVTSRWWVGAAAIAVAATACSGTSTLAATDKPLTAASTSASGVPFALFTHCGIQWLTYRDQLYRAIHPMLTNALGVSGAPDGFKDPYQRGRLVRLSATRVRFDADGLPSLTFAASKQPGVRHGCG